MFEPKIAHPRYTNESGSAYGIGISQTAPKPINDESKYAKLSYRPDTPTFKPMQVINYTYDKDNVANSGREPVIVFETRWSGHPFSKVGAACMLVNALTRTPSKCEKDH